MPSFPCLRVSMYRPISWTRRNAIREGMIVTHSRVGASEAVHARHQHGELPDHGESSRRPARAGRANGPPSVFRLSPKENCFLAWRSGQMHNGSTSPCGSSYGAVLVTNDRAFGQVADLSKTGRWHSVRLCCSDSSSGCCLLIRVTFQVVGHAGDGEGNVTAVWGVDVASADELSARD